MVIHKNNDIISTDKFFIKKISNFFEVLRAKKKFVM